MPRVLGYGEDGLTLKYTKERLGNILQKLGDNSKQADCTVFFRPSFGRGQYGEFDAIIISKEKAYFVEAKWDSNRDLKEINVLREDQIRHHKIFEWFSQNWRGEVGEDWNGFAKKNNPEFKRIFTFKTSRGKDSVKSIPKSDTTLGKNLRTVLEKIGDKKLENVLLIFYKDKPPKAKQNGFVTVFVQYKPTLGLFSELE
jgi:hypothetical protein